MRKSLMIVPLVLVMATAVLVLAAATTPDDHQSLHELMEGLKDNLKGISKNLENESQRPVALQHIAQMEGIVLLAKEQEPTNMDAVPEADRAAHALAFRSAMAALLAELAAIEQDICAGDNAAAMTAVRGKLLDLRNAGHDEFQPKDEHPDDDH